jgi:aspartate kinase
MALLVQKYGGTSVGSIERIEAVADKVATYRDQGHDMVIVVSAMSGETNRLVALAQQIDPGVKGRELDVLLTTGEQVTIALLHRGPGQDRHRQRAQQGAHQVDQSRKNYRRPR